MRIQYLPQGAGLTVEVGDGALWPDMDLVPTMTFTAEDADVGPEDTLLTYEWADQHGEVHRETIAVVYEDFKAFAAAMRGSVR